jgi:polysaccharide biosynthesis/export protein
MKINNYVFLSILFLYGCASTAADIKVQNSEDIKPISVSEFTLGPGDKVNINVWRHNDLNKEVRVDMNGNIYYSFVGDIQVSGMSINQLRDDLKTRLSKYYVEPVVDIEVTSIQSQKVFVLGEVSHPGIFFMDKEMSVLEAVAKSGGFTHDAKQENVLIIRGDKTAPELIKLDLEAAVKKGALNQNISLLKGDIVYVPPIYIADVSRYFRHLDTILRPILLLEQAIVLEPRIEDVFMNNTDKSSTIIIEPR